MKETQFNKYFVSKMWVKFPHMWGQKIHGHEMQSKNIPDNLFCVNGRFMAIEFKVQRDGRVSIPPGQIKEINNIKNAGGIGLFVAYDESNKKILLREKRLDHRTIYLNPMNKEIKARTIKINWDFEFNNYESCIDMIMIMVENE